LDFTVNYVDVNERYQLEQCHVWDDTLDTRRPPVEDPVKLADFCQLSETWLNATGHWSSMLTPVVKRAATIVISFAEIRGLYLAQRIFAHAVLPFLLHFPI
jgi:hypothetical protein